VSRPLPDDDPAMHLLLDEYVSAVADVHRDSCYICRDPEFAQMGMPLCRPCPECGGHVPADDSVCDDCGHDDTPEPPDVPAICPDFVASAKEQALADDTDAS
jgi:hypothetical protein